MPEHKIRLRAAWEADFADNANTVTSRLDLPIIWPDQARFPIRLRRAFNAPRYDTNREALFLSLQNCSGISLLWIDGSLLQQLTSELANPIEIELPSLSPARHVLELELALDTLDQSLLASPNAQPWGEISLVFRDRPGPTIARPPDPSA